MGAATTLIGASRKRLAVSMMVAAIILVNIGDCAAAAGISLNSTDTIIGAGRFVDDLEFLMDSEAGRRVLETKSNRAVTPQYLDSKIPVSCDRNKRYSSSCIGPKNPGGKKPETRSPYKR